MSGSLVFAQIMQHLPWDTFSRCVSRYGGDRYVKAFTCADQYREAKSDARSCAKWRRRPKPTQPRHSGGKAAEAEEVEHQSNGQGGDPRDEPRVVRLHARLFDDWAEIGSEVLRYVADQTETDARHAADYRLGNRTARLHRAMIVDCEGFTRLSKQGRSELLVWLIDHECPVTPDVDDLVVAGFDWCRRNRVHVSSDKFMAKYAASSPLPQEREFSACNCRLSAYTWE